MTTDPKFHREQYRRTREAYRRVVAGYWLLKAVEKADKTEGCPPETTALVQQAYDLMKAITAHLDALGPRINEESAGEVLENK